MTREVTSAEMDEYLTYKKAERLARKKWEEAEVAQEALWMTADEAGAETAAARKQESKAKQRAEEASWVATAWARAAAAKAEGSPVEGGKFPQAKKARKETLEAYTAWTVAQGATKAVLVHQGFSKSKGDR